MTIGEIESIVGIHEDVDEEVDTVGGLVLARLGRIARVGDADRVRRDGASRSPRCAGRRILRVLVVLMP